MYYEYFRKLIVENFLGDYQSQNVIFGDCFAKNNVFSGFGLKILNIFPLVYITAGYVVKIRVGGKINKV